mmetsp:Transcript_33560/g.54865  ORF Transcript_33560/g.54865 Transcript_33560/m.54865 type:complete len:138 (+) Transcript_33560:238-651(+)
MLRHPMPKPPPKPADRPEKPEQQQHKSDAGGDEYHMPQCLAESPQRSDVQAILYDGNGQHARQNNSNRANHEQDDHPEPPKDKIHIFGVLMHPFFFVGHPPIIVVHMSTTCEFVHALHLSGSKQQDQADGEYANADK